MPSPRRDGGTIGGPDYAHHPTRKPSPRPGRSDGRDPSSPRYHPRWLAGRACCDGYGSSKPTLTGAGEHLPQRQCPAIGGPPGRHYSATAPRHIGSSVASGALAFPPPAQKGTSVRPLPPVLAAADPGSLRTGRPSYSLRLRRSLFTSACTPAGDAPASPLAVRWRNASIVAPTMPGLHPFGATAGFVVQSMPPLRSLGFHPPGRNSPGLQRIRSSPDESQDPL